MSEDNESLLLAAQLQLEQLHDEHDANSDASSENIIASVIEDLETYLRKLEIACDEEMCERDRQLALYISVHGSAQGFKPPEPKKKPQELHVLKTSPITSEECCVICFDTFDNSRKAAPSKSSDANLTNRGFTLECRHRYCNYCFSSFVKSCMVKTTALPLCCAVCRQEVQNVQVFLSRLPSYYISQDQITKIAESKFKNPVYCSNSSCSSLFDAPHQKSTGENASCPKCGTLICTNCKASHDGISCIAFQKLPLSDRSPIDVQFFKLGNECKWKQCPKCGIMTERIDGCVHMMCGIFGCGTHFCYNCGEAYKYGTRACKCDYFAVPNDA